MKNVLIIPAYIPDAKHYNSKKKTTQGYSGFPIDQVLDGVSCVGAADTSNSCFVVDAGANLHFESDSDCPGAISKSRAEIKSAMESGEFNNLEGRIVDITYLEASDLYFSSPDTIESSSTGNNNELLPVHAWGLIGLAGVLSIASVALFVHRRYRSRDEEAVNCVPVEGVDNAGEPPIDHQVQSEVLIEDAPPQDDVILLSKMESQDNDEARPPKDESQDNAVLPPQEDLEDADENNVSPLRNQMMSKFTMPMRPYPFLKPCFPSLRKKAWIALFEN